MRTTLTLVKISPLFLYTFKNTTKMSTKKQKNILKKWISFGKVLVFFFTFTFSHFSTFFPFWILIWSKIYRVISTASTTTFEIPNLEWCRWKIQPLMFLSPSPFDSVIPKRSILIEKNFASQHQRKLNKISTTTFSSILLFNIHPSFSIFYSRLTLEIRWTLCK